MTNGVDSGLSYTVSGSATASASTYASFTHSTLGRAYDGLDTTETDVMCICFCVGILFSYLHIFYSH